LHALTDAGGFTEIPLLDIERQAPPVEVACWPDGVAKTLKR
jgi:hypothetical protein